MIAPADCCWVSPSTRPYSQTERMMLQLMANVHRSLDLRDDCASTGQQFPPPVKRFEVITTHRNLTMRKRALRA